ncbi:ATP-binding protein [Ruminococcus sp.]|uniref:ATP-binding protein n=1 Tax=Ruminococcus sp. TaxID=41978 RepID=UPI003EFEC8CE
MLEIELIKLIEDIQLKKTESNYIEVKSARNGCPKIFDTLSSFSNQQNGGTIIFGVDENEDYNVCGVYDAADLQKKIMEQSLQMEPVVRPLCTVAVVDGKTVVSAEIQEMDNFQKPCFYKGAGRLRGSYVRVADGDRLMTEYEVYSYEAFKQDIHDELRTNDRAEMTDINTEEYQMYLLELKKNKPNLAKLEEKEINRLQGFVVDNKPTVAALMLFSVYPQAYFPQLCITAVSVPGKEMSATGSVGERFIDNKRIEGSITQMLNDALIFVRKNMKVKTIIDVETGMRNDRTEYPVIAVRELVLNALIHRDYSIHTESAQITITMYSDRMEIENPGGLYGRMTLDNLGFVSADTRNPYIAGALEIMGETENRYSGIPTIRSAMKNAGLPQPVFVNNRGVFKAILYNEIVSEKENSDLANRLLDFCSVPRSRKELDEKFKEEITIAYLMSKHMKPLIAENKIALTKPESPKSKDQKYYTVK